MFTNLSDLSYQRTTKQAIWFYIVSILVLLLWIAILSGVLALVLSVSEADSYAFGQKVWMLSSIIFSFVFSLFMLKKKWLIGNIKYILLALLGWALAVFGWWLLWLIIPSYITTKPKYSNKPTE